MVEEKKSGSNSGENKRRRKISPHLIMVALIVIIAGISVFKLVKWNIGVKSDYDPNYYNDEFDVEVLDNIIPLDPDKLKGHEDDGVTTILCLGNDPFSDETGDNGLAARIAEKTEATVYNGSFPSSRIGSKNVPMDDSYLRDYFNLYGVAQAVTTGDFSMMSYAASFEEKPQYAETVKTLEDIDYSKIDILAIMYDGIDYIEKVPVENPADDYDLLTYTGSLRSSIELIQEKYPYIRIILMSHTFAHSINEEGNFQSGSIVDLGNGALPHYLLKEIDVAMDCGVSLIDNYYGTVNEDNYLDYMTDYIHFNDAGRDALATRFAAVINRNKEKAADKQP